MSAAMSEIERERAENMRRNAELIAKLGLDKPTLTQTFKIKRAKSAEPKTKPELMKKVKPMVQRKSSRLECKSPINYSLDEIERIENKGRVKNASTESEDEILDREEKYTAEDLEKLGKCMQPYTGTSSGKIYDKVLGTTCHQCRQKTLDKKTTCSQCKCFKGMFCGPCLQNRYGENILEVINNESWVCPVCRKCCNCSFCRSKRGLSPTGILSPLVKKCGYDSVAHFLINKNLIGAPASASASASASDVELPRAELSGSGDEAGASGPSDADSEAVVPRDRPAKATAGTSKQNKRSRDADDEDSGDNASEQVGPEEADAAEAEASSTSELGSVGAEGDEATGAHGTAEAEKGKGSDKTTAKRRARRQRVTFSKKRRSAPAAAAPSR
mmetsp:Transcript_8303/g.14234  ORF Transcript_8303/g.14234 Transcript_8303/m.14234 type:complete len:387 (-) Transcript_8303:885-2045(-)